MVNKDSGERPELMKSDAEMGQALGRSLAMKHPPDAARDYENFLNDYSADVLYLNGSPDRETAAERAETLYTNVVNMDDEQFDILVPEEEYLWNEELLEGLYQENDSLQQIYLSEDFLEDGPQTAIDDVLAAQNFSENGETVIYHDSSAHARATEAAAEEVHWDTRRYKVFGIGSDSFHEHLKQRLNAALQKNWHSKKNEF